MSNRQQVLPGFSFTDDAYFDNFYITEDVRLLVNSLQQLVTDNAEDFVYICGQQGLGKTHLLQAVYHMAIQQNKTSLYLPLSQLLEYKPTDVFAGSARFQFLCLDELDVIIGNPEWEVATFDLYNQRIQQGLPLYMSGTLPAARLAINLADLKSRLAACLSFQIADFTDEEKVGLLRFRAMLRGMDLNEPCASFILQRSGRNIADLINILRQLDQTSLEAGRKITVPFIKSVLDL